MKSCPVCQSSYPDNYAVCPQDGTPLVQKSLWTEGSVIRGKYRILAKVGQGGMGAVYKAEHLVFGDFRAIKVMAPELLSEELFVKRFKHEAFITHQLEHPNAVRVHDMDEAEDGRPFIVMEFIEGRSLKKLIQEEGPLPVPRVCSIIKQAAAALDAAHRLGMVHRDIKPDNIVLVETPAGEQAKVLDFGIAKVKEARLTEGQGMTLTGTGVVIGTPQYMSPEQAMGRKGDELDGRADLYSLGIVMYQMLSGDLPFHAETTMEMLMAHVQTPPAPIRSLHPELQIPEPIADLTMRLLEKDRNRRPATARILIEELERAEKEAMAAPRMGTVRATLKVTPEDVRAAEAMSRSAASREAARPAASSEASLRPSQAPGPKTASVTPPTEEAVRPPVARQSNWGLWVGIGIVVVALGWGGWFIITRSSGPSNTPQTTSTTANTGPANERKTTASDTQSTGNGQQSGQDLSGKQGPTGSGQETNTTSSQVPGGTSSSGLSRGTQPKTGAGKIATHRPLDPRKVKAALTLATVLANRGQYDDAIDALNEALKEDPENPQLLQKLQSVKRAKATEERLAH